MALPLKSQKHASFQERNTWFLIIQNYPNFKCSMRDKCRSEIVGGVAGKGWFGATPFSLT